MFFFEVVLMDFKERIRGVGAFAGFIRSMCALGYTENAPVSVMNFLSRLAKK